MNLNQLYYFQAIARLQHFTQAAEELHISQPSLSYAMASLEKELGTTLFEKHGRNIALTKYGKIFLTHVNLSLKELEDGKRHIHMAYLRNHTQPPALRRFLKYAKNNHFDM